MKTCPICGTFTFLTPRLCEDIDEYTDLDGTVEICDPCWKDVKAKEEG